MFKEIIKIIIKVLCWGALIFWVCDYVYNDFTPHGWIILIIIVAGIFIKEAIDNMHINIARRMDALEERMSAFEDRINQKIKDQTNTLYHVIREKEDKDDDSY